MSQRLTKREFAALFGESARPLWCIALAVVGDRTLADDVLQDAAVIGLQKIDAFQPGTSFTAWMGQIVRNVARNRGRARARGPTSIGDPTLLERAATDSRHQQQPVTSAGVLHDDQASFDDHVTHALDSLNETARACLLLRTVLDQSYREIAQTLSIPEGTAMSHVHRARTELRQKLSGPQSAPEPTGGQDKS